jgi:hypothetical protein
MRDFRDIGHKAIYVANSSRALKQIGWQHAEPVLRSLAYALLAHEGGNPAKGDAPADRSWKQNQDLAAKIRADWAGGKTDPARTTELLATLRTGSASEASEKVVELLNAGVAPQSIWEALFDAAGELVMRDPKIVSLHAVTTTNAMHFAFGKTASEETKRLLLLQNAAFIPGFRGSPKKNGVAIDQLEPLAPKASGSEAVAEILADISHDRRPPARCWPMRRTIPPRRS